MTLSRTSLTAYAGSMRDPDPAGQERFAREAWHRLGAAVFTPEAMRSMNPMDRELVTAIANRLHGKRN